MSQPPVSIKSSLVTFFIALSFFTFITISLTLLFFSLFQVIEIPRLKIYFTFIIFFAVTLLVHYLLLRASAGRPQAFVRNFTGTTFIKLFIYFGFVIISTLADSASAVQFILFFFILYLAYTAFEVFFLFRQMKGGG